MEEMPPQPIRTTRSIKLSDRPFSALKQKEQKLKKKKGLWNQWTGMQCILSTRLFDMENTLQKEGRQSLVSNNLINTLQ